MNYSYVQWLQTPGDGGLNIGAIYLPIENTTNQCFFYITYTGEVAEIRTAEAVGTFAYPAHRGGIVANAPLSGDMIGIVGGQGTVHRFGNLLPWAGSVMPIAGLGRLGTSNSCTFAAPFTIEAQGTGAMGAGWFSNPEANQLWGENGHGTLDFGHVTDIQWTAPQLGDRQAVTIGVPVAGGTPVHLVVQPEDIPAMQPLHHRGNFVVEIFETQNPANREVWGVFLNSLGRVTVFTNFPPGTYSVSVKGQRWLRRTLIDALEVTVNGARLDVPFHLTNGDIDRDNEVSISDYASLSAGFGAVAGTTRYQQYVVADLNEDGSIDIGDYSILSRNFGQVGDD